MQKLPETTKTWREELAMVLRTVIGYVPRWRKIGMQVGREKVLLPLWERHIWRNDDERDGLEDQVVLRDQKQSVSVGSRVMDEDVHTEQSIQGS